MAAAIEVRDLWKRFVVRHNREDSLKGRLLSVVDSRLRERQTAFWALQGVSLEVASGKALAVIGPNGSGKSTLLRLVARTLQATRGEIVVRGRVSPMLEIGAGFHQELTGIENIYLNGALMGLTRYEIGRLLPAIVAFAELEEFIDVPVKNYSSGMHARLGFSIAAHTDPDILLIDEALSVGDQAFQEKCHQRMRDYRKARKTIMLVSHDLRAVAELCDRVCVLVGGRVAAVGSPEQVLPHYQELGAVSRGGRGAGERASRTG